MNYLDVPFEDKDEAKSLGAFWDPKVKRWFAPEGLDIDRFSRWHPRPDLPELLPGENREYGSGLYVDLIPRTSWFSNVRSSVATFEWDRVRRMVYGRANYSCEACGATPNRVPGDYIEAHERWEYDNDKHVQRLVRLIALCTDCHTVTHFGRAQATGKAESSISHLMKVSGATRNQADSHIDQAFRVWEKRSKVSKWRLDLSILTSAGISLQEDTE